jgi:hypothetical protein
MYDFVSGLNVCVFCSRRLCQCGLLSKYIRITFLRISSCTSLGASQTSTSLSFCSKNSDFLFWNSKSLSLATWVMVNAGRQGGNLYLKEGPLPLVMNGQSFEELLYRVIPMITPLMSGMVTLSFLSVRRRIEGAFSVLTWSIRSIRNHFGRSWARMACVGFYLALLPQGAT